jgi:hypothetical protein
LLFVCLRLESGVLRRREPMKSSAMALLASERSSKKIQQGCEFTPEKL